MTAGQGSLFDPAPPADPFAGPGQARTTDPGTSHAAAAFITAGAGTARVLLARAFRIAWTVGQGLTAEEAARTAGLSPTSEYATRVSELMRMGVVDPTGELRPGRSGQARAVYRLTAHGAELLAARDASGVDQ